MQVHLFTMRNTPNHLTADQEIMNTFLASHKVIQTASQYVSGNPDYWSVLIYYDEQEKPANVPVVVPEIPSAEKQETELNEEQQQLFLALRTWRKEKSTETQHPEYLILHNATLTALAREKPRSLEALGHIKGLGEQKIRQFGAELMSILNAF